MPRSYGPYCVRCGKVAHNVLLCQCGDIICSELCYQKHRRPDCPDIGARRILERRTAERQEAEVRRLSNTVALCVAGTIAVCICGACVLVAVLPDTSRGSRTSGHLAERDPDDWRPTLRTGRTDDGPPRTQETFRDTGPLTRTEPSATTPRTDPMLPGERTDRTERTGRTTGPIVGPIDDPRTGRTRPVPAATPIAPADLAERHDRQQVTVRGKVADVDARTAFTFEGGLVCTLGAGSTDGLKPGQVVTVTGTCYIVQGKPKLGRCDIVTRD